VNDSLNSTLLRTYETGLPVDIKLLGNSIETDRVLSSEETFKIEEFRILNSEILKKLGDEISIVEFARRMRRV
jgi:hypothetical protein